MVAQYTSPATVPVVSAVASVWPPSMHTRRSCDEMRMVVSAAPRRAVLPVKADPVVIQPSDGSRLGVTIAMDAYVAVTPDMRNCDLTSTAQTSPASIEESPDDGVTVNVIEVHKRKSAGSPMPNSSRTRSADPGTSAHPAVSTTATGCTQQVANVADSCTASLQVGSIAPEASMSSQAFPARIALGFSHTRRIDRSLFTESGNDEPDSTKVAAAFERIDPGMTEVRSGGGRDRIVSAFSRTYVVPDGLTMTKS
mmetsp:Transcript_16244/g.50873  ORF Transcript_16244/g.50873 Transcript_16244/m.50873 type:complete len:253 (+) Transcript_16244:997-1755(+)